MPRDRILVAEVGAPHGLKGEVRLRSFTADPETVKDYSPLIGEDGREFVIDTLRRGHGMLLVRFRGVTDRDAAARLRHLKLYVPRERLPPAEAETFYHADLIGLAALTRDGRRLGTVVAVHNFGAGDLIEVAREATASTVLVPFTKATVPVVDIAGGHLVIDPPPGLLGER
jgi:16S rRNA processing protein RimM